MTMQTKDRIIEGKEYRQQMMDKLSLELSEAETCRTENESRELYVEKLEKKINDLKQVIDDMTRESKHFEKKTRQEFEKDKAMLETYYREAVSKLDQVRRTGTDAWLELQDSSVKAWKELAQGVRKALGKFH